MNQVEKIVSPSPLIGRGIEKPAFVRAAVLAALVVAAVIALAAIATRPFGTAPETAGGMSGVTDGWMLHVPEVSAARPPSLADQVTDGWALSFLTANRLPEATDGWAGRYLPSAQR